MNLLIDTCVLPRSRLESAALYREQFGPDEVENMMRGRENRVRMMIVYELSVNEYKGRRELQAVIRHFG